LSDIELADSAAEVVFRGTDEQFRGLLQDLEVDELVDVGLVLTKMSGTSAIRAGLTAYEIRKATPDGEWGREVFRLAQTWEVSDRTIHRWMRAAQEHFQLELTPAQENAKTNGSADTASAGDTEAPEFVWDDDEEDDAGFGEAEGQTLTEQMNAEAGWGDDTLPSSDYESKSYTPPTPVPLLLEPDETWVAFTMNSIMQEHEGYSDVAAQRSAVARWARKLDEEPLDLLEELVMIYESEGDDVPDEIAAKLIEADERKVLTPDEVTGPKEKKPRGKAGPKFVYDTAEKLLVMTRNLAGDVTTGTKDGTVTDKQVAAMLPHLESVPYTLKWLIEEAKQAKARYLASNPPVEERIAETVAAEADNNDDPGF
jgi:hypothetical protein